MSYTQYFETKKRVASDEYFVCLKDNAPENLVELIRDIHWQDNFNGCLANDWVYETIYEAFDELDKDNLDDINIEADCSNYKLKMWLLNPFSGNFCDYVLDNIPPKNIIGIIEQAQIEAKQQIYYAVSEFLDSQELFEA